MKWTKRNIDNFFIANRHILLKNNVLIPHKEIMGLWKDYYNWYQAIVRKYNTVYNWMDEFRTFHWYELGDNIKWSKEKIDTFYNENINQLTKNNRLLSFTTMKKIWNDSYNWYQAISRWTWWYSSVNDFRIKNWLVIPEPTYKWTKEKLESFYYDNRDVLTNWKYMIPYDQICNLWSEFRSWIKHIVNGKCNFYKNYDHFKKLHNLKTWRTKCIK